MTAQDWINRFPEVVEWEPFAQWIRDGEAKGRATGQADEARAPVTRMGRRKFGPPTTAQEAALAAVTDLPALEALAERLLDVSSWDELLAPPAP